MRISVIIPQYGRWQLTAGCLSSLRRWHAQSPALEWIVVDDGSGREDRQAAQRVLPGDVLFVEQAHRGVTAAWNHGWRKATGDALVFLNNDTETCGPWLSQMTAVLGESPRNLIGAEWMHPRAEQGIAVDCFPAGQRQRLLAGWMLACCREAAERVGPFNEQMQLYFSDTDWQLRWLHTFGPQEAPLTCPLKQGCLRHRAHATTRQLSGRSAQWNRDRREFLRRWRNPHEQLCSVGGAG